MCVCVCERERERERERDEFYVLFHLFIYQTSWLSLSYTPTTSILRGKTLHQRVSRI